MTPVFLNPPPSPFQVVDQKDHHHHHHHLQQFDHLFLSSHNQPSCDLTLFNSATSDQDQRSIQLQASLQVHGHLKVDHEYLSHHRSNDHGQVFSVCKREVIGDGSSSTSTENGSATKWMSSKTRLMQKMMNNTNCTTTNESEKIMLKIQNGFQQSNEINSFHDNKSSVRVCSDCNTTTTPLWRSGPRGPKSLCNACGIRQRKARRAMEAAAAGNGTTVATTDTTKIKIQHNKEKKSRTSHVIGQYKKQHCKPHDPPPPHEDHITQRNLCFKDFDLRLSNNSSALKQVFPQDVEEAAILLMELSCGFFQS